jgi:enoyl-CoA hydratase
MIHREDRSSVTVITLDREDRRNAVDHETLDELHEAIAASVEARVIVLTGAGEHFCAGADLKGVEDATFRDRLGVVLRDLRDRPQPTIAAVHGAALGAGTQLAVACDLRVATPDARFGIPAARLGLMVDQWTVRRVAMLCGQGPASAMLLAAETISGSDASTLGLVQRLGDLGDALAWADDIAALAPLTIAGHKLALNALEGEDDGFEHPAFEAAFRHAWGSEDLQEGLAAFREGRRPIFRGK